MEKLTTVSGKPLTIVGSFRVTVDLYPKIVAYAEKKGISVSKATAQLWKEKLDQIKEKNIND